MILSQYHIFELDTINIYSTYFQQPTLFLASFSSQQYSLATLYRHFQVTYLHELIEVFFHVLEHEVECVVFADYLKIQQGQSYIN